MYIIIIIDIYYMYIRLDLVLYIFRSTVVSTCTAQWKLKQARKREYSGGNSCPRKRRSVGRRAMSEGILYYHRRAAQNVDEHPIHITASSAIYSIHLVSMKGKTIIKTCIEWTLSIYARYYIYHPKKYSTYSYLSF